MKTDENSAGCYLSTDCTLGGCCRAGPTAVCYSPTSNWCCSFDATLCAKTTCNAIATNGECCSRDTVSGNYQHCSTGNSLRCISPVSCTTACSARSDCSATLNPDCCVGQSNRIQGRCHSATASLCCFEDGRVCNRTVCNNIPEGKKISPLSK